jgi:hypothetical protein
MPPPPIDDHDLIAFMAARREAEAAGISQQTPVDPPGLVDLLRRAGLLEAESPPRGERPPCP